MECMPAVCPSLSWVHTLTETWMCVYQRRVLECRSNAVPNCLEVPGNRQTVAPRMEEGLPRAISHTVSCPGSPAQEHIQ